MISSRTQNNRRTGRWSPSTKTILSAAFVAVIGIVTLVVALQYPIGELNRFGPGLYPAALGFILLGLATAIVAENDDAGERGTGPSIRAVLSVLASVLAFSLLVKPAGAVVATCVLVLFASFGQDRLRPLAMIVLMVVLSLLSTVLFIELLKMPMRAFPWS